MAGAGCTVAGRARRVSLAENLDSLCRQKLPAPQPSGLLRLKKRDYMSASRDASRPLAFSADLTALSAGSPCPPHPPRCRPHLLLRQRTSTGTPAETRSGLLIEKEMKQSVSQWPCRAASASSYPLLRSSPKTHPPLTFVLVGSPRPSFVN